jgi:hypothetical protein
MLSRHASGLPCGDSLHVDVGGGRTRVEFDWRSEWQCCLPAVGQMGWCVGVFANEDARAGGWGGGYGAPAQHVGASDLPPGVIGSSLPNLPFFLTRPAHLPPLAFLHVADVHYWKDDGTVTAGALASDTGLAPHTMLVSHFPLACPPPPPFTCSLLEGGSGFRKNMSAGALAVIGLAHLTPYLVFTCPTCASSLSCRRSLLEG